jgi:methionine synthase II (cobalamin-independent)
MQRSETSIRTSHAGRLPAVGTATNAAKGAGSDSATPQVVEVIKKQVQIGIDCVGDGEFWNDRNFHYYGQQLSGVTARELRPGERGSGREETRERDTFPRHVSKAL